MASDGKSFWHTLPGLLTASAAFVTAVAGLLGILVQADLIGPADEYRPSRTVQGGAYAGTDVSGGATPTASGASAAGTSSGVPWDRATATLVRKDGTHATVKAPTVALACEAEALTFENGQRISLDIVRSVRVDRIYTENSSADGVVTLLDGRELTDPIHTWNCPVTGTTELGPLTIPLEEIARIEFDR